MKLFDATVLFGIVLSVECGPLNTKRDVFNPERLMESYKDTRTNQGLFGSYHPDDLVNSIVQYFDHNLPQSMSNNQWGMFMYNPNEKMAQYMGNLNSPGSLGPEMDEHDKNENIKPADVGGSTFNPTALNQRLMQSAFSKSNQFSNFVQPPKAQATSRGHSGFDADALNRQLMESAMHKGATSSTAKSDNSTRAANTEHSDEPSAQMLGFNPDTVNAGLLHSLHAQNTANSGKTSDQGQTRAMALGFNPNKLNAGLFSSLSYDPNSVVGQMPTYSATMSGERVHGVDLTGEHTGVEIKGHGQDSLPGSSPFNNMAAVSGTTGTGAQNTESNTATGSGNPFQLGNTGGQGNMANEGAFTVNQSGSMPHGYEMNHGEPAGSFTAGGIGSKGYINQMAGHPPGVPAGSGLKQAETAIVKVHGIGGMG